MSKKDKCPYCGAAYFERFGGVVWYACRTCVGRHHTQRTEQCKDNQIAALERNNGKLLKANLRLARNQALYVLEKKTLEDERDGLLEFQAGVHRLTRCLDVELCGEEGAAKQASLCDLVGHVAVLKAERDRLAGQVEMVIPLLEKMRDRTDAAGQAGCFVNYESSVQELDAMVAALSLQPQEGDGL